MPTLRFIGRPFDGFEKALERQVESFNEHHEQTLELDRDHRPLPEIHEELVETGVIADEYDLFLCLSDWLPALADEDLLLSLEEYLVEDPPADWPEGWAESMRDLVSYGGTTYGIPYHDGPEIFHYRRDLFESVAEQRAFREEYGHPLHVPKTWPEFLDVAEFFTRPEDDLWGTVVAALPDGHNNVYDFLIQLWSRGGEILNEQGQPAFDNKAGREALQFYHDLLYKHEVVPPEATEMESVEAGQFYADGKAAMMWNWAGFGALAENPNSTVFGDVNYGLIPRANTPTGRHTGLTVLYGLTIPANCDHPDLAYEFIKHAAKSESDQITTEAGASGTRFSTWRNPTILRHNSFYSVAEEVNTSGYNTLPQIPEYVELNEILNEMVEAAVVDRSKSIEEALSDAANEARELLD